MAILQGKIQWHTVQTAEAAKLCLSLEYTPVLEELMLREWAVSPLARQLQLPLNAVHHRVQRLLQAKLIQETHQETRQGRPIRYYRAVAEAFLIPYHLTALSSLEELVGLHTEAFQQRLNRAIVQTAGVLVNNEDEIGLRIFRQGDGITFDITPRAETFDFAELLLPDRPALLVNWGELNLTFAQAKSLQRELGALFGRYAKLSGPERYLFRLDLVPEKDTEGK